MQKADVMAAENTIAVTVLAVLVHILNDGVLSANLVICALEEAYKEQQKHQNMEVYIILSQMLEIPVRKLTVRNLLYELIPH